MADQVPVTFIDNPHAPEIHATGFAGLWLHGGNLHVTLTAGRYDHGQNPGSINNVVNARIVMPIEQMKQLAEAVSMYLNNPKAPAPVQPTESLH